MINCNGVFVMKKLFVLISGCLIVQNTQTTLSEIPATHPRPVPAERRVEVVVQPSSFFRRVLTAIRDLTGLRDPLFAEANRILANVDAELENIEKVADLVDAVNEINDARRQRELEIMTPEQRATVFWNDAGRREELRRARIASRNRIALQGGSLRGYTLNDAEAIWDAQFN